MKISDISWDTVRMVSINDFTLRVTTDGGIFTFRYANADELSSALLILSLTGTKKVEMRDEQRFNPARFLSKYRDPQLTRCLRAS